MKPIVLAGLLWLAPLSALAQTPPPAPVAAPIIGTTAGEGVFARTCAACHKPQQSADPDNRAPALETLRQFTPEKILTALTSGKMQAQAAGLTDLQRRAVAMWLSGSGFADKTADAASMPNRCTGPAAPAGGPAWNGWSPKGDNTRFQDAKTGGLTGADLPRLRVKWAFGVPGGAEMSSQPTVVDGTVYFAADIGQVYALDARTGCVRWSFATASNVRVAPVVVTVGDRREVVLGDMRARVYAVDAATGRQIWRTQLDDQALARIVGAPTAYGDRIFVGVASSEEVSATQSSYECCTMRGSVSALDAATGKIIWKTYPIAEPAKVVGSWPDGRRRWGQAGVSIWGAPTIDPKLGLLYVGTGDSFTAPAHPLSDSVLALSMATGKLAWSFQVVRDDAYMSGCDKTGPNCPPTANGPDYDIAASVMLQTREDGRRLLLAGHKGGGVVALDPDRKGALVWRREISTRPIAARGDLMFGGAADQSTAYYALRVSEGMAALDLKTGWERWYTPAVPPADRPGKGGSPAAVTLIHGAVLDGGADGVLHAYSPEDGHIFWSFDTVQPFDTVNKVAAKGGSMGSAGATVAGGMLFLGTGYPGTGAGLPGNLMLALGLE